MATARPPFLLRISATKTIVEMRYLTGILLSLTVSCCICSGQKRNSDASIPQSANLSVDGDCQIGKPLPAWSEGCFDIHAINSARGECTFLIMPDGTTAMFDAGDLYRYKSKSYASDTPRPDIGMQAYKVYAAYVKHFMPQGKSKLDYFVLSHYHGDHMGYLSPKEEDRPALHSEGSYYLVGLAGVYEDVGFRKIIDRSYPDYSVDIRGMDNYRQFIEYNTSNTGLVAGKAVPGSSAQIVLTGKDYPDFKATCYVNNGCYWDGKEVVDNGETGENQLSNGFLFSYGKFDYYTSGDQNSPTLCRKVAESIGHPIEAMKCNHHMSNPEPIATEIDILNPKVVVTQSFYVRPTIQPHPETIDANIGKRHLFFTNIDPSVYTAEPERYGKCTGMNGHFVIRVFPGGKRFNVYQLDDTDTSYRIKAIFGPYTCD